MFTLFRVYGDGPRIRDLRPVGPGFSRPAIATGYAMQLPPGRYEVYGPGGELAAALTTFPATPKSAPAAEPRRAALTFEAVAVAEGEE